MEGRACSENAYEAKRALEASHAVVEIKIKTLDSQVYTCRVGKNVSVPDLKEQIALVTGVPSESQRLICRGKVLKDEHVLSAYDVEDGHTLHLVTRPVPPPSIPATSAGVQSEEQDPHAFASRNRPGHISHSVLVGTFNIPDRGGVVFPEINRIFSSVLSSLRVGSIFPPSVGTGNGNGSTVTVPLNTADHLVDGQEREENADGRLQERTDHQLTTATDQRGSGDMGPSIDDLPSLRADVGFVGAIPAVSQVRIVQQIVPDALRTVSQYVNRMEQVLAANGQARTSVSNLDTQSSAFPEQTEQQQSPVRGDGDPAAWASMIRRIQELLSNQAGSELRRLADQLEVESSLQTATARSNILSAGILMEHLGRLLLDLGRTTSLRRDSSQDEATVNARPPYLVSLPGPDSSRLQPGGGLDFRTEMASRQAVRSMYYLDSDDTPGNMGIHIHAGLPPFLVARPQSNFLSQPTQDGPPLSFSMDGTRVLSDFQNQNDQAENGNTTPSIQASLGSMQPPMDLGEHGAVGALPMRTLVASVPESSQDHSSLDGASAGRGVFYPLLARFQQLNPALFSHQAEFSLETSDEERSSLQRDPITGQRQHPSLSILRSVIQDQVEQVVGDGEAGSAEMEHVPPSTSSHLEAPISDPGTRITGNTVRSTAEGVFETNSSNISDVSQNLILEDLVRPLLHAWEAPQTVAGRRDQLESDQLHTVNEPAGQVDAETSLQLKCSGQTVVETEQSNCASKSGTSTRNNNAVSVPIKTHETSSREMKEIEAVLSGLHSDGLQPFSCRKRACDHLDEQVSTREPQPLHDFCGRMDEVTTTSTRGTVLQDFLSTLACRRDERSDAELVVEQIPQELSLVLENVENHGLCLDSPGSNMVENMPLSSPHCLAESWQRQGSCDVGLGALVASAGLDTFRHGTENNVLGNDSLSSVPQNTSRQDGGDRGRKPQQLFPVASHISSRQILSDSEGALYANQMEDGKTMDNGRLLQIQQSSASVAMADKCQGDSGRHIAGASREGLPAIKRQKMQ